MAKYPLPCLVTQDAFDLTPFGQWLLLQNATLQGDRLGPHLVVHRNTPERTLSVMERKCQCQRLCDAHGHFGHVRINSLERSELGEEFAALDEHALLVCFAMVAAKGDVNAHVRL